MEPPLFFPFIGLRVICDYIFLFCLPPRIRQLSSGAFLLQRSEGQRLWVACSIFAGSPWPSSNLAFVAALGQCALNKWMRMVRVKPGFPVFGGDHPGGPWVLDPARGETGLPVTPLGHDTSWFITCYFSELQLLHLQNGSEKSVTGLPWWPRW